MKQDRTFRSMHAVDPCARARLPRESRDTQRHAQVHAKVLNMYDAIYHNRSLQRYHRHSTLSNLHRSSALACACEQVPVSSSWQAKG
eukprot:6213472-Pleurochrysis_carterae.AAC.5